MTNIIKLLCKIFIFLTITSLISVVGIVYYYAQDLPDYKQLANYYPPALTRIYSADGKLIEEYAKERRIFVPIESVPKSLIEAFIAAEDKNFYEHSGIDLLSIFRAAIANISNIIQHKRVEGASTITQQVVKNFLLTSEQSIARKVKEAILSYMISQIFTKNQILELYLNQIYLGKHAYGVATAAQSYFDKSVEDLNIAESAFLAGLPKAPSTYNPEKNYKKSKQRRDYVLIRMYEDGYISKEALYEYLELPIVLKKRDRSEITAAPYYAEQVRNEVINLFGKDLLYTGGLTVITSLNTGYQKYAEQALRNGLLNFDQKRGWRGALANIKLDNWLDHLKKVAEPEGLLDYQLAVVLEVNDTKVKIGLKNSFISYISLEQMKWARYALKSAKNILKTGDVIVVSEIAAGKYALSQIPEINGATIAMEPSTGRVLALVGGYDFKNSQFNRATQALRQPGSIFKTFVYLAALESGITPATIFNDGPIELNQGPGLPLWRPKNYAGDFLGLITMREGLEKSRNLITIRVAQQVGINKIVEVAKRFNINNNPPKLYSMILGSLETTLDKLVTAYAVLASGGKEVIPHYIEVIKDRNGKIIYKRDQRSCHNCNILLQNDQLPPNPQHINNKIITDEASAYQICSILNGVVQRGTGQSAKNLSPNLGGKTGTTNDSKDTFFIGISPDIVIGTFVGYDTPRSMGKFSSGSSIALPIFVNFMSKILKTRELAPFAIPESISLINIDPKTGLPSEQANHIVEAFKVGTEPSSPIYNNNIIPSTSSDPGEIY